MNIYFMVFFIVINLIALVVIICDFRIVKSLHDNFLMERQHFPALVESEKIDQVEDEIINDPSFQDGSDDKF